MNKHCFYFAIATFAISVSAITQICAMDAPDLEQPQRKQMQENLEKKGTLALLMLLENSKGIANKIITQIKKILLKRLAKCNEYLNNLLIAKKQDYFKIRNLERHISMIQLSLLKANPNQPLSYSVKLDGHTKYITKFFV